MEVETLTNKKEFSTNYLDYRIDENGILITTFKAKLKDTALILDAEFHVSMVMQLTEGKPHPILNNLLHFNALPSPKIINFLGRNTDLHKVSLAKAFVLNSFVLRMIIKQYVKIAGVKYPFQVFKTEKEAVEWLKEYC